jgi:D-erythrose 4-phosphate dehydrogenase
MPYKIAINGYGRIGRCVLRALYESDYYQSHFTPVAINEVANSEAVFHLTKYDSTHGRFPLPVKYTEGNLVINDQKIRVLGIKDFNRLPWDEMDIDIVLECSGSFKDRATAYKHIKQGAKRLIFSQPATREVDATIVYGVNHQIIKPTDIIISNASCTTNCIIPVIKVLDEALEIEHATITTIHSAMHDQPVIDAYNTDLRKTRSALQSIIPVSTGLDRGITRILPKFDGKIETLAIRVPTTNVSLMDLTAQVNRDTSQEEVNLLLKDAAQKQFSRIMNFNEEQLVSCDFNHDRSSSIIDGNQTRVSGKKLVKVMSWFDNEWGYANRMLDTAIELSKYIGHFS